MEEAKIRNIVVLGIVGAGKKTLGNRIFGETIFSEDALPEGREPSCFFEQKQRENTLYKILIVDTGSTQQGFVDLTSYIKNKFGDEVVHAIFLVVSKGRYTDESHDTYTNAASRLSDEAKKITSLIITNCEQLPEDKRKEIASEFEQDSRCSVLVQSAEKGTYTVGFPNISTSPPAAKEAYERITAEDAASIRRLIETCSEYAIPSNGVMTAGEDAHVKVPTEREPIQVGPNVTWRDHFRRLCNVL